MRIRGLNRNMRRSGGAQLTLTARAIAAIRRAGGTVLAAGAATPVLGAQRVTNGTFDSDTAWSKASGVTISGGTCVFTGVANNAGISQAKVLTAGQQYLLGVRCTSYTSGTAYVLTNDNATPLGVFTPVAGKTHTVVFTAQANSNSNLYLSAGATLTATFDDFSIEEVTGYTYGNPPTRNYFDSAGTDILDSVTQVDQPVGLVLDGAGSVGAERLTNPGPFDATTGWSADVGLSLSAVGGNLRTTSTVAGASARIARQTLSGLTVGATYQITAVVGAFGGAGAQAANPQIQIRNAADTSTTASLVAPAATNCTITGVFVATDTSHRIRPRWDGNASADTTSYLDWSSISVRELTGNHATQATTGSKSTLRRGIPNLSQYSRPNSGQWLTGVSGTGASPVVTHNYAIAPDGSMTATRVQLNKGAGATSADFSQFFSFHNTTVTGRHTTALWVRTTDGLPKTVTYRDGNSFGSVVLDGNWKLIAEPRDFTGQTPGMGVRMRGGETADSTADLLVWDCGLFSGTVTAQQILDAGGIPLTTTSPASSAFGKYWWQFDPAAPGDFLQLGSVPFQLQDNFAVVVGYTPSSLAGNADLFAVRSSVSSTPLVVLRCDITTGRASGVYRDDAGQTVETVSAPASPVFTVGQPGVASIRKVGNTKVTRFNGVAGTAGSLALGSTTADRAAIGVSPTASPSGYTNGNISAVVVMKATVSDADLALIERFVGSLQGQTL